jgi:hypothetical protein
MAGAKRQRIAKRIRVRYPEEDESGRPRPDLRAEADVTSAHKGLSDRGSWRFGAQRQNEMTAEPAATGHKTSTIEGEPKHAPSPLQQGTSN